MNRAISGTHPPQSPPASLPVNTLAQTPGVPAERALRPLRGGHLTTTVRVLLTVVTGVAEPVVQYPEVVVV